MKRQKNKCAYCERWLESTRYGKIGHDFEHFRPKNNVSKWPTDKITQERNLKYSFKTGEASCEGYLKLWHHPINFLTACKPCNSSLKADFFPIAGRRNTKARDPRRQQNEKALLIYPLGNFDTDPEELIGFYGYLAIAKGQPGSPEQKRGMVTIDFFDRNRHTLIFQRAEVIAALDSNFRLLETSDPENQKVAQERIERMCTPGFHHSACAKAFRQIYRNDDTQAKQLAKKADALLNPK